MEIDRRGFLKISGVAAALGLAAGQSIPTPAQESLAVSKPLVGKRWAMVIDLRKCREKEGCQDCISACHRVHNVPSFPNAKHEVKWIWKETFEHAFPELEHPFLVEEVKDKPALVFCNHCDNPPCTRVCPTQATWKREKDGIVMMDWHRCIGCRYCVVACPYGSRSFNWRDPRPFIEKIDPGFPTRTRGVVEKCTFCEERLSRGLRPACVEACQEKALTFGDLENPDSEIRHLLEAHFSIRRKPELGTNPQVYYIV